MFSSCLRGLFLNGVDEGFFDTVEDDYADEHHNDHEGSAVTQASPGGVASPEEASAEGLDDGGDRVDVGYPAPILRNG